MPTKSGLLLEYFARLAANAAGTPAAVIGLLGRRSDPEPKLAAFGITSEEAATLLPLDAILAASPGLTVVPDLLLDDRFQHLPLASHPVGLRFVGHLKLLSPGEERVGFICVLDQAPRDGLTRLQAAALEDIAGIIMANRSREQRHVHFMHVANRALRVDRMVHLVSDAASCADALTGVLEELCRFHAAAAGRIWQVRRGTDPIYEISRYDALAEIGGDGGLGELTGLLNASTVEAISRNEPHAVRFGDRDGSGEGGAASLSTQVCIPIWVQQQRFAIVLAFTAEPSDLDAVVADVASLADAIRPALFRKVTEERIRFVAHHDHLTELPNRLMFQERLDQTLAAARAGEHEFAVLYLDLDGFKLVNDTHGHEAGDQLLTAVAQRLRENVRECDTVARMGGDEFAIIQPSGIQPAAAVALASRLLETLAQPFQLEGRSSLVGISIGIATYPQNGESADLLLRNADTALYRAKEAGRNTFQLFEPAMQVRQQERFQVEQELRDAIERGLFTLAYQPVCDAGTLRIVGFEALLRWNHPTRGEIPPDRFIPVAESIGLIIPLGQWALETACIEAATWAEPVYVSVNLSPLQFRQPDLPDQVAQVLARTGLPADRLELEVTEGLLLDESSLVLRTMQRLHEQGIRMTLDDFGTAYASLSYLRRFPFDRIKIDKSFIRGLSEDDSTRAIVHAVLSLGERLKLSVVAEGVESRSELDALRQLNCRLVQGFWPGPPTSSAQVHALLRQQNERPANRRVKLRRESGLLDWQHTRNPLGLAGGAAGPVPYGQGGGGE